MPKIEVRAIFHVSMQIEISDDDHVKLIKGVLLVEEVAGFDETALYKLCSTTADVDYDWETIRAPRKKD